MLKLIALSVLLLIFYIIINISGVYLDASVQESLNNLKNKNLYLLFIINEEQDNKDIYQCGVDLITEIGMKYGKEVDQIYIISKQGKCYYNNITTQSFICLTELYLNPQAFILILDNSTKSKIELKNRALIVNPSRIKYCSDLFN